MNVLGLIAAIGGRANYKLAYSIGKLWLCCTGKCRVVYTFGKIDCNKVFLENDWVKVALYRNEMRSSVLYYRVLQVFNADKLMRSVMFIAASPGD